MQGISEKKRNDILMAIVNGRKIQDKTDTGWMDITPEYALRILSGRGGDYLRVAKLELTFNSFIYTSPTNLNDDTNSVTISLHVDKSCKEIKTVTFSEYDDAEELYSKLSFGLKV